MYRCARVLSSSDTALKPVLSFPYRVEQAQVFHARCRTFHPHPRFRQTTDSIIPSASESPALVPVAGRDGLPASTVIGRRPNEAKASHKRNKSDHVGQHANSPEPERQVGTVTVLANGARPIKTRSQSRLERKFRRQRDGTYRREGKDVIAAREIDSYDVEAIISQIEKLHGPKEWPVNSLLADETETTEQKRPPQQPPSPQDETDKGDKMRPSRGEEKPIQQESKPNPAKRPKPKLETWKIQKRALEHKFGDKGWDPRKRLSPDTLEGVRALHASDPSLYSTAVLADNFKVSPEAIRRILRSKWKPTDDEKSNRTMRWEKRGERKWQEMAAQGARPPAKWRAKGVRVSKRTADDGQGGAEQGGSRRLGSFRQVRSGS